MTNLLAITQTGADWLLAVLIIVVIAQLLGIVCLILAHYKKLGAVLKAVKNWFVSVGRAIKNFFVKLGKGIARWFRNFHERFMDGSVGTKLSHFFMGAGNLYHGQIFKGLIFLAIQILFVLFMALSPAINDTPLGFKALVNFGDLGYIQGDFDPDNPPVDPETGMPMVVGNSMLILLFGVVTLGVIVIYLFLWLSNIASAYKADTDSRFGAGATTFKQDLASMLDSKFHTTMLAPTILGVTVFTILPTVYMILVAFTTYGGWSASEGQTNFGWAGFQNFVEIFTNGSNEIGQRFLPVLLWTVIWAVFATFTNYFGGIFLAILINRKGIKGKTLFRTVFIMTIAIPQFISLLAMKNLLSGGGPINSMLMNLGITDAPINFLGNDPTNQNVTLARTMIILINMWVGVPYTMLMTSGILMNIPSDLYEAAKVDGARPFKIFCKITFPYIFFITTPYLISSFIGNVTSFNIIFMLTGGGPAVAGYKAGQTDLLVTWLYKLTVENSNYNQGAVIGIITFICTSILTLVTYRRSKAYKEEDTFQ